MAMKMDYLKEKTASFGRLDNKENSFNIQGSIKAGSYASLPKSVKTKFIPAKSIKSKSNKNPSFYLEPSTENDKTKSSRNRSKEATKRQQSPVSQVYKSLSKCHKYHTDLDYSYLIDKKFKNDALNCAKDKITPIALKESSPDRYYYDKEITPIRIKNDYLNNLNKSQYESKQYLDEYYNQDITENKLKTSKGVISNVIDSQFSIQSPSKLKLYKEEMEQIQNENMQKGDNSRLYMNDDNTKLTINLSYTGENPVEKYLDSLEAVMLILDPIFDRCTLNEKIEKFLEIVDDHRRNIRLGSLVALYQISKKYDIDDNYKVHIIEKTIHLIQNYEIQEELFLVACLEILSLYSPNDLLFQNLNLVCMFITDFNYPRLQKAAFNCIMSLEYEGIKTLIELASKDYQDYQRFILSNIIKTPHIQKIIIIRALLNEVSSNNADRRHNSLAALNRMHDLLDDAETLTRLSRLFSDSKIEKIFLSSTLRTAGEEGERILLNELRSNKDFSVRVAIASVLNYRLPKYPKYLEMRLDNNDTYALTKNLPGSFCTYYGKVTPLALESDTEANDFLLVSTRDLLASLQRMLHMNWDHTRPQLVYGNKPNLLDDMDFNSYHTEVFQKYIEFYEIKTNNETDYENLDIEEIGKKLINEDIIKSLCICLKDYSTAVRETAASSLGQIGLPESLLAIDSLLDGLKDDDVNVKSKIIWTIGRIAKGCDNSVINPIVESLKNNMWKVKSACLYTLANFGNRASKSAMPLLKKLLKESAINKQAIAETMVKLGAEGEAALIKLMSSEPDSNYKVKSSVCRALALTDITSPNIDFIIETLFKAANISTSGVIRKDAIFAIRILAEKSEENITYLKRKNLIPFYYEKLMDKDPNVQNYVINCIKALGPQGELIFIEGLTKDVNTLVRINCAVGLAELGPHTIRTLLIALHDDNISVRKTVEKEISEKIDINDILICFSNKPSQKFSLKITVRDLLEKGTYLNGSTRKILNDLLIALERDENEYIGNEMRDSMKKSGQNLVVEDNDYI